MSISESGRRNGPLLCALALGMTMSVLPAARSDELSDTGFRPATYDWSGPHLGVLFGLDSFNSNYQAFPAAPRDIKAKGRVAGAIAGYNFRNKNWVFGPEADISYSALETTNDADEVSSDIMATIRGRIGYRYKRVLPYVTAGLAIQKVDYSSNAVDSSMERWHPSATAGAGVEVALGRYLSARIEYLHIRALGIAGDFDDTYNHVVRAASSYHFGN